MKLSEAIRLGATMRPQIFGRSLAPDGSCALGAAAEAIGRTPITIIKLNWFATWPILKQTAMLPLEGIRVRKQIDYIIVCLNDDEHWTRERIADWVELQEGPTAPEELPDPIPQPEEAPLEVA